VNSEKKCYICLQTLQSGQSVYHPACCKKLFSASIPPELPYTWSQLNEMAESIIRQQVAVPGVQPKLSLHLESKGTSRPARFTLVSMAGGFILKPPVREYPNMPELEHLTMRMASKLGIATAECGLINLDDGQRSYITRRMDRQRGEKLHMEDMCQLTDRVTEQKYRGSMEQVGKAVLKYCTNPVFDTLRLFELTLFCFLTGNSDMHLKNFSLLYTLGGEVSLSPAYDLLPTNLLLPADMEESALTINGKKNKLNVNDFLRFGSTLRLTEVQIQNALERIFRNLDHAVSLIEQGFCSIEMKERYHSLIIERTKRLK